MFFFAHRVILILTPGDAAIQHHADISAGLSRGVFCTAILLASLVPIAGCLDFGGGPVHLPDGETTDAPADGDGAAETDPDGTGDDPAGDPAGDLPVDETAGDDGPGDPPAEDLRTDDIAPEDLPADDSPPPTEDCDNGIDDDGDGKIDCADEGCRTARECEGICSPVQTITCDADVFARNDDPGSTDRIEVFECEDNDGYEGPEIAYAFTNPAYGKVYIGLEDFTGDLDVYLLDSDGGLCDTNDCLDYGYEPEGNDELIDVNLGAGTYYIAVDGWEGTVSSFNLWISCTDIEDCDNAVDDDEDGYADCRDSECRRTPACPEPEDCDNHFDDDFDGEMDCADSDCATDPDCLPPEDCDNAVDDDGDSLVDCADTDCASDPACPP